MVGDSERILNDSRVIVANLTARLSTLQQQIIENERNLEIARNLTEQAQQLANQTDAVRMYFTVLTLTPLCSDFFIRRTLKGLKESLTPLASLCLSGSLSLSVTS